MGGSEEGLAALADSRNRPRDTSGYFNLVTSLNFAVCYARDRAISAV